MTPLTIDGSQDGPLTASSMKPDFYHNTKMFLIQFYKLLYRNINKDVLIILIP